MQSLISNISIIGKRNTNFYNMSTIIESITFYTIQETAFALQVSTATVRNMIKDGRLKAQKIGQRYLITEGMLRSYLKPSIDANQSKPSSNP